MIKDKHTCLNGVWNTYLYKVRLDSKVMMCRQCGNYESIDTIICSSCGAYKSPNEKDK